MDDPKDFILFEGQWGIIIKLVVELLLKPTDQLQRGFTSAVFCKIRKGMTTYKLDFQGRL